MVRILNEAVAERRPEKELEPFSGPFRISEFSLSLEHFVGTEVHV